MNFAFLLALFFAGFGDDEGHNYNLYVSWMGYAY
jgi:hypothetical protein